MAANKFETQYKSNAPNIYEQSDSNDSNIRTLIQSTLDVDCPTGGESSPWGAHHNTVFIRVQCDRRHAILEPFPAGTFLYIINKMFFMTLLKSTWCGRIVGAETVMWLIIKSKSIVMSTNGWAKLSCSLGSANFDWQTIPDRGSSLVEQTSCRFSSDSRLGKNELRCRVGMKLLTAGSR